MKLSVNLIQEKEEYIATCPELDVNCYGSDKNEAIRRIKDVIHFYVNAAKDMGLDVDEFDSITFSDEEETSLSQAGLDLLSEELH